MLVSHLGDFCACVQLTCCVHHMQSRKSGDYFPCKVIKASLLATTDYRIFDAPTFAIMPLTNLSKGTKRLIPTSRTIEDTVGGQSASASQTRTSNRAKSRTGCFDFCGLPPKIRCKIYAEVLKNENHEHTKSHSTVIIFPHRFKQQPRLSMTCHLVRYEMLPLYFDKLSFFVRLWNSDHAICFIRWVNKVGDPYVKRIKRMHFMTVHAQYKFSLGTLSASLGDVKDKQLRTLYGQFHVVIAGTLESQTECDSWAWGMHSILDRALRASTTASLCARDLRRLVVEHRDMKEFCDNIVIPDATALGLRRKLNGSVELTG